VCSTRYGRLACLSPAIRTGVAGRTHRRRSGGSGWPGRSPTSTKPRVEPTVRCVSPRSCATAVTSVPAMALSRRSCARSGSRATDPPAPAVEPRCRRSSRLDPVGRGVRRDRPNELWLTDITSTQPGRGRSTARWCLTLFSRLVVGWSIDFNPDHNPGAERARDGHPTPPGPWTGW